MSLSNPSRKTIPLVVFECFPQIYTLQHTTLGHTPYSYIFEKAVTYLYMYIVWKYT